MKNQKQKIFLVLLDIFTLFIWLWLMAEFVSRGRYCLPTILSTIYIIVLTFYASDKEIRRWKGGLTGKRRGEVFVFLWILTLVLIVGHYLFFGQANNYLIPKELPTITGAVVVIYIITDYLKKEFRKK